MRPTLALLLALNAVPVSAQFASGPVDVSKGAKLPSGSPVLLLSGDMSLVELPSPPAVPEAIPQEFRDLLTPIYDEEGRRSVIGFVHQTQGVFRVFDLDGRLAGMYELPLRPPVVDPISILAGGVAAGMVYGVGSGVASAARSLVTSNFTTPALMYASAVASSYWKRKKAAGWVNAAKPQRAPYLSEAVIEDLRKTAERRASATAENRPVPSAQSPAEHS